MTTSPVPAPGGRSLRAAVVTAFALLGLILLFTFVFPQGYIGLVVIVVGIAAAELFQGLRLAGRRPSIALGVGGVVALMLAASTRRPGLLVLLVVVLVYLALLFGLRRGRGAGAGTDAAWTILGILWLGGGGAAAVSLLRLGDHGEYLLTTLLLVTAAGDVAAYFVGVRFGRHKMAPTISPAKSWEGLTGGATATVVVGLGAGWLLPELTALQGLLFGIVVAVLAPFGDLVESLVKREVGIKDSGTILPGHGGFLDRIDAIVFCAPAAYFVLHGLMR